MTGAGNSIGAPIVSKSAAEQVVTAPVLTPGDPPDRERHWYSAKNIAEVAQSFLPDGSIDAMHAGGEVGHPTESWVAKQDLSFGDRTVSEGSWMVSAKVTDDAVWGDIESGDLTGVSVFGPVRAVYDEDGNELDIQEIARPVGPQGGAGAQPAVANSFGGGGPSMEIPPAPVGSKWRVEFERATHVSVVDDPALREASFVVAKSASGRYGSEELIMDQDTEERFDELETLVQKSADSAEAAAESADDAQTAAEEAVENGDGGDSGDGGGGGDEDLTAEGVRSIVEDTVEDALGDVAGDGDGDGSSDGDGGDLDLDADLDGDTVETLVEAGVIDEETAAGLGGADSGVEKRLAAIEKALQNGGGRQGAATQLDGVGGEDEDGTDLVSNGDRAAAFKRAGTAGGQDEGGDDE